jgi:hypothetical protein
MTGLLCTVITASMHGRQVQPAATTKLDLDLITPLVLMVGPMEGRVEISHEVRQHKHREWLARCGFMHVGAQPVVAHDLCRGTGAIGLVLSVACRRTHRHVIIVLLARSRDVLVRLVFAMVEVGAQGGQLITPP